MSKIDEFLDKIKKAVYGEEVRSSIVGAIEQCYSDVKANVEQVLKEHPEYTSTVQDGSISEVKLSTEVVKKLDQITPRLSTAVSGNMASFGENGVLIDSGLKLSIYNGGLRVSYDDGQ